MAHFLKKKSSILFLSCLISISPKIYANIDTIVVSSFQFTPSTLTIISGDSIYFSGPSGIHPVVSETGAWTTLTTSTLLTTEIQAPGTYPFYCQIHGAPGGVGMSGVLTVLPPPIDARECANLFFSEYYEGSSWNKALEIYNPTYDTVDLSNYSIKRYTNGSPTATATLNLAGQLLPGDVYVIVRSNATNTNLLNEADTLVGFPNFDGNDALALFQLTDSIDIIGVIGQDSIWVVGSGSTLNNTLVRKSSTHQGQLDWSISATEWDVYPIDDSSYIGFHIMDPTTTIAFVADAGIDDTLCLGNTALLNASAIGGTNSYAFAWFTDITLSDTNIANPVASPVVTTDYYVIVTDLITGCSDTGMVTIVVIISPIANAGIDDTVCSGNCSPLLASGGITYSWSPGTGLSDSTIANPLACPSTTINYVVTVVDAAGCSDMDTITIVVNSNPTISIIPSADTICFGDTTTLTASGAVSYLWSPASSVNDSTAGIVNAFPTSTTTYTVNGVDANGCINNTTITVLVSVPAVSVTPSPGIVCSIGDSVMLTASGALTYTWSPSDSLSNTTGAVVYANPTVNTVYTVIGTDSFGCVDITTVSVQISTAQPVPVFTADTTSGCGSVTVSFTNTSTDAIGYSWYFPGGTTADTTLQNPAVSYNSVGTFDVTLTAFGCSVDSTITITGYITVNPIPVAGFTTGNVCLNNTAVFTDTSTVSSGSIVSWQWNFGDGFSIDTNQNPSHNYVIDSLYFVTLSVVSNNGCTGSALQTIEIYPLPSAGFTSSSTGDTVVFADASTGTALIYSWDFGDGAGTSIIDNPVYIYSSAATYNVCLTVTDGNGCEDTFCESVTVVETGIQEQNSELAISIYPNPTNNGMVNIDFGNVIYDDVQLTIYNILGEIIQQEEIIGKGKQVIDLPGFAKGVYLLYFRSENFAVAKKLKLN